MTAPEQPPADNIDVKDGAHRVALAALSDVVTAVQRNVQRLNMYEQTHRAAWGHGSTLSPVRAAALGLRQVAKILTPMVQRAQKQNRQFDQSNFEPDHAEPDVTGR